MAVLQKMAVYSFLTKATDKTIMKLFIGNLGNGISAGDLHELFSVHGKVVRICVPKDEHSTPLGYGYVTMETSLAARKALQGINKKQFMQQFLSVSEALCAN
jgi:heterogeneous nuclear ribonucleoprotein G